MRQEDMRESDNVEDRRGMSPKMVAGGGVGVLGIIVVIVFILMGGNPQQLLQNLPQQGAPGQSSSMPSGSTATAPANDEGKKFVARVLGDTEDVWTEQFRKIGKTYVKPKLVLFSGVTDSGCGTAESTTGPFYCPADQKVYIDLSFYDELAQRFGAPGDFAQAYVIAHEIGHHVQQLTGISDQVTRQQQQATKAQANALSVRLELQADYLAGVWAHHAQASRRIIEAGDIEEALRCAAAIGDDRLQRQAGRAVVPDSFTHGTSEQRARWFKKGFETGDFNGMMELFKVANP